MKRRRRGTGAIEPQPDGTFRPRLPGNGERMRACATYKEAERLLDAALAVLADGSATPVGGVTLASFGEEQLDARELRGVAAEDTDRSRWKNHIASAFFASWPLRSITTPDVYAWLDGLQKKRHARKPGQRLGRSTVKSTLNLLRVVLERAVERGLLEANPARVVRLPPAPARTHEPWTYLLPDEQRALVTCPAIAEERRLLIAFALGTGMREGEVWHLEARDVDLERGRITVRRGSAERGTKGKRIRRIPLFGLARLAFERQLERLEAKPNPLAWPLPGGTRRQKGAPAWWDEALVAAGIAVATELPSLPRRAGRPGPRPKPRREYSAAHRHDGMLPRWHDLRHTCASSLVAGWWGRAWRLEEVQKLLGHKSITTTEMYAHLADSVLDEAARSPHHLPGAEGVGGAKPLSHLRDLNSRPTVYEGGLFRAPPRAVDPSPGVTLGRLAARAAEGLQALAAGGDDAYRLATEALADVLAAAQAGAVANDRETG